MTKLNKTLTALAVGAMLASGAAFAQGTGTGTGQGQSGTQGQGGGTDAYPANTGSQNGTPAGGPNSGVGDPRNGTVTGTGTSTGTTGTSGTLGGTGTNSTTGTGSSTDGSSTDTMRQPRSDRN